MTSTLRVTTIQNTNTSNIITQTNATTLTIGASGQTISIPSGATLNTTTLNVTTVVLAAGAVGTPALTTSGDTNTGIFFPAADTIAFTEGGTEAMRIDSSGNVGIGNTSPAVKLDVTGQVNASAGIAFAGGLATGTGVASSGANGSLRFYANGNQRVTLDSATGDLYVTKTSSSASTVGIELANSGFGAFTRSGNLPFLINRLVDDGTLLSFRQDTSEEGTISVSGTTVSYNGFTGSHWSRFIDESKPDVLRGTVMESLDQMVDWYAVEFEVSTTEKDADGNDVVKTHTEHKPYALKANEQEGDVITYAWNTEKKDEEGNDIIEQVQATIVKEKDVKHVMSKISDTSEAKNVYGVFHAWDNDDLINNDFYVASVGSYVVRIKAGQTVSKGDLLQSNGDGTAKVQADDLVRASSFAKVLSNTVIDTYEDGSFIVPCSLMC